MFVGSAFDVMDFVPDPGDVLQKNARETGLGMMRRTPYSSRTFIRRELPELTGTYLDAFESVSVRKFRKGQRVYRSPGLKELKEAPGAWFSTRRTATKLGTDSTSNVAKWRNPLDSLRTFEFTEDVTVYYGKVHGGTGYQILIPEDVNTDLVLRFVEEVKLK